MQNLLHRLRNIAEPGLICVIEQAQELARSAEQVVTAHEGSVEVILLCALGLLTRRLECARDGSLDDP